MGCLYCKKEKPRIEERISLNTPNKEKKVNLIDSMSVEEESPVIRKLKKISLFPCSIKLNAEYCKDCFKRDNFYFDKAVEFYENRKYSFKLTINEYNDTNLGSFNIENNINLYHDDNKFKYALENINNKSKKSCFLEVKIVLFTLDAKKKYFEFEDDYIDIFNGKYKNDKEAFKELDRKFKTTGYYVPMQIEIGGKFIFDADDIKENYFSEEELNSKTNLQKILTNNLAKIERDYLANKFNQSETKIIGGDTNMKNYEIWEKSITLDNAQVIGFNNLVEIVDLIPTDFRRKLEGGINLLRNKYEARNEYIKIYNEVKAVKESEGNKFIKGKKEKKEGSYKSGRCKEGELVNIKVEEYECKADGGIFRKKGQINTSSTDIIVGFEIDDRLKNGGNWSLEGNPLLSYGVNIDFVSKWFRGNNFGIKIYIMEKPE